MSKRIGNIFVVEVEADAPCEFCSRMAELRPYGPGGMRICFKCMKSSPEMGKKSKERLGALLNGTDVVVPPSEKQ